MFTVMDYLPTYLKSMQVLGLYCMLNILHVVVLQSALHAFTEPGQGTGLLLIAALSEPALDGPHIPVELLGQALQSLLIWVLARQEKQSICKI